MPLHQSVGMSVCGFVYVHVGAATIRLSLCPVGMQTRDAGRNLKHFKTAVSSKIMGALCVLALPSAVPNECKMAIQTDKVCVHPR